MAGKSIGSAILEDLKNIPRNLLKPYYKGGKLNANKVMIDLIPFTILFYVTNKYLQAVDMAEGGDFLDKCVAAFSLIFQVPPYVAPSFKMLPLLGGISAGVSIFTIVYILTKKEEIEE